MLDELVFLGKNNLICVGKQARDELVKCLLEITNKMGFARYRILPGWLRSVLMYIQFGLDLFKQMITVDHTS